MRIEKFKELIIMRGTDEYVKGSTAEGGRVSKKKEGRKEGGEERLDYGH